ncbi:MAG: metallophosphoesterase, partial [Muricauda sp.]|nr:metallophosphoesterase [Allomuricauda sp.]
MKKHYLIALLIGVLHGCATYQTKYADSYSGTTGQFQKEVEHTFYLIGDAGKSPMGELNPTLKKFKKELESTQPNSTAIFLGDNIYPAGFVDKDDDPEAYRQSKHYLDAQLATLEDFKGRPLFIPGNHDWYSDGLKGLKREEEYVEDVLDDNEAFQPENGCPIEDIEISDKVMVIAIDTEWYLVNWDKHPTINDECEIKSRERFFEELESLIKKNRDKTVIIAMHHPLLSYGVHGGQFSFKQGLYPSGGKVPMPFLGAAINLLRKTSGASAEDLSNQLYNELKKRILTLSQYSDKIIFASGHEHTLQYIEEFGKPQIVSGSGTKTGATRLLNGSKFSTGMNGYAVLTVYKDGSSDVVFHGTETDTVLYHTPVLPPDRPTKKIEMDDDFPAYQMASVYAQEDIEKSKFHKWLWGERYRKYYGTQIKAPTVRLDTLFGGLTVVRKGGGNQSNSLRLADKQGREYVMRDLRKSAERYLQAIAFQEQYIIGEFQDTYTQELLLDLYTGAHPYAPFTIGKLSEALGMFHTNPKLYYVPKQSVLGDYNKDFGNSLYMIEEHVSDDHDNLKSFGYTKKIESTYDLMDKLREDEEYSIDQKEYAKARLFDIMIGDWDRHVDQWRWAEFETEEGNKVYKPIARDRDQVFSRWGDGLIMGFGSMAVPGLRIFEGFHEEIRSVEGFTSSPRTFALDMALLSETDLDTWVEQAEFIQQNLNEEIIDEAFLAFPEEVRDETLTEIKRILLARKANLVQTAKDYFAVLNRYSVVTGTDKDDYFNIVSLPNGHVEVRAYRIKGGEMTDLFFNKVYDPAHTKEIWVYGLDDDDVFDARTETSQIKVRIVGGQNNDVYKISEGSKKLSVYDFKDKKNTLDEADGGKIRLVRDYDTNTYEFLNIKASNNQLLPTIGFNPDDGVRIGLTDTYTFNGFRKNPFTQQHTFNAAYYFATDGFDLGYRGEFAHVFNKVNLEVYAKFTSPNFTRNFFGFGNETVNNDDTEPLGLDYNRVRIRTLQLAPSLVWRGFLGSKVKLGLAYENIEIEETEDRFINEFYV